MTTPLAQRWRVAGGWRGGGTPDDCGPSYKCGLMILKVGVLQVVFIISIDVHGDERWGGGDRCAMSCNTLEESDGDKRFLRIRRFPAHSLSHLRGARRVVFAPGHGYQSIRLIVSCTTVVIVMASALVNHARH